VELEAELRAVVAAAVRLRFKIWILGGANVSPNRLSTVRLCNSPAPSLPVALVRVPIQVVVVVGLVQPMAWKLIAANLPAHLQQRQRRRRRQPKTDLLASGNKVSQESGSI